jgi:hypothetical protein
MLDHLKNYISKHLNAELTIGVIEKAETDYQLTKQHTTKRRECLVTCWNKDLLVFAVLYSFYENPANLYIEKIDTSGYDSIVGLATTVVRGIIDFYSLTCPELRIQIYCATAEQYLFHQSKSTDKKVLSDRDLIKWWLKVCDFMTEKYFVVPGESLHSVKRMMPSQDWKWGLGVEMNSIANQLPIFPDDMIKKGLEYADKNATVSELLEIMGCMETASGMRAIIVLKTRTENPITSKSYTVSNYDELVATFMQYRFDTREHARNASKEFKTLVPEKNLITFTASAASIENIKETVKPKVLDIGLVKRKSEIRDLTNLVKKKKV